MIQRFFLRAALLALSFSGVLLAGDAGGSFTAKLSSDQKIEQALSRLTFGPRPGDIDAVRKMGLQKWIELQLHPGSGQPGLL
ncbi:MAG TPA: DUF1800 family protein [Bryobacteraceae bacterium]|nr:DUF1800 family protein [Bryobacteraceae bacterium]